MTTPARPSTRFLTPLKRNTDTHVMKSATPQNEIGKVFATAVDLHQKGHLREAESLYRAILAVDAKHADAFHLCGVAAHQRGDHITAAEMIGQAIELKSDVP
jgi:Flp pilus assembly protein TadD